MNFENVTTWSGRKRHQALEGDGIALCSAYAKRPGDRYVGANKRPLTQELIDALPSCGRCSAMTRKGEKS